MSDEPIASTSKIGSQSFSDTFSTTTSALDEATTHAASLPPKSDLSFHRTLDRKFGKDLDIASGRILNLAERLLHLVTEGSDVGKEKGKSDGVLRPNQRRRLEDEDDVIDGYRGAVGDVLDSLLEDADSCLDELNGQKKKAVIEVRPASAASAGKKLPGPFSEDTRLSPQLYHASSLAKPQKSFPDVVNNSRTRGPWRPSLQEKSHAMVPLDFVLTEREDTPMDTFDDEEDKKLAALRRERDIKARSHPYYYETKHLPYPTSMFVSTPPIAPREFDQTPFVFVDTKEQLEAMIEQLKVATEIAVDLEHHSMRSYDGFTCLMQISTRSGDWVVDTLALRGELREGKLGGVFVDPSIIKIFHGADSDILWLQRDFDMYVVNLFDTYHATKVLDFPSFSLASLLSLYCAFQADKRYQMADWRIRPLPQEMLYYARSDTHYLLFIYDNLRNALLERSSRAPTPVPAMEGLDTSSKPEVRRMNPQQAIRDVLERSAETALKLYERDAYDEVTGKGTGGWGNLARKLGPKEVMVEEIGWVFKRLHVWRDQVARDLDESTHYVLPNQLLISLSLVRPRTTPVLLRSIGGRASIAAKRAGEVMKAIQDGRADFLRYQEGLSRESTNMERDDQIEATPQKKKSVVESAKPPSNTTGEKTHYKVSTKIANEIWSSVATPKAVPVQRKATSSMFGSTVKTKPMTTSSASTPKATKATSSLFGPSVTTSQPPSSGSQARDFAEVQSMIYHELLPQVSPAIKQASAIVPSVSGPSNKKEIHSTSIPEQVPFVAESARTTLPSAQPSLPVPTLAKEPEKDTIVVVKKSRKPKRKEQAVSVLGGQMESAKAEVSESPEKKKRTEIRDVESGPSTSSIAESTTTSAPTSTSSKKRNRSLKATSTTTSSSTSSIAASMTTSAASVPGSEASVSSSALPEKTKRRKQKINPSDIPVFDYSKEGNLLDDPKLAKARAAEVAKDRKAKRPKVVKAPVIDTSLFRKPPMDPSQPKGGNKSGTFT